MVEWPRRFRPLGLRAEQRIERHRLTGRLAARFDARLTLVTGAAGHGKSTALAGAVAANRDDPLGSDIWLSLTEADADPVVLTTGLTDALDLDRAAEPARAIESVVAAVWSRAPTPVVLILDDAHHLAATATAVVEDLLDRLPANGHVVLAARTAPPLRLARLDALGLVERIEERELLFDDGELAALARHHGAGPATDLPRLPALADLTLRAGPAAGDDYLWEEVLAELDPERLGLLTAAAVVDELDDELVAALSDGRLTADGLTAGLPMVEADDDGRRRLHARLREALVTRADPAMLDDARRRAAAVEVARDRLVPAARLLADAGDPDGVIAVADRFAALPMMLATVPESSAMAAVVRGLRPDSLTAALLEAQIDYGRYDEARVDRFVSLARRARRERNRPLEALAILRAAQGVEQGSARLPKDLVQRIGILATEDPFSRAVDAHIGSAAILQAGDGDGVRSLIRWFDGFEPRTRRMMTVERLCQLGLLEEVGEVTAAPHTGRAPGDDEILAAYASWLRGDAEPELALPVVEDMIRTVAPRAHRYTVIALLAVGTHIAIAAGDDERAAGWAERAASLDRPDIAPGIRCYAKLARAMVDHAIGSSIDATRALDDTLATRPIGNWPAVPYLMALSVVYQARPEARPVLDRCRFGPALLTSVAAGRALIELRDHGRSDGAAALPWSEGTLLRIHVPPRDLVELAAAAAEAGVADAAAVAETIPDLDRRLAAVAIGAGPGAAWAADRRDAEPVAPSAPLRLRALGQLEIERPGAAVDPDRWRRSRVRELLAFLIEHRSTSRSEVAAALWPDLSGEKRTANLRVNLTHLLAALEPERRPEADSSYITVDGERLALGGAVEVDVDRFDRAMDEARRLDQAGDPGSALGPYRAAVELVAGPYLDGLETDWLFGTRTRLRSATAEARCRVGELTLARGEPEEASLWAVAAQRRNPLDERAGRLLISCLAAVGDRASALDAAARLVTDLEGAGITPERDTERLIDRIRRRG